MMIKMDMMIVGVATKVVVTAVMVVMVGTMWGMVVVPIVGCASWGVELAMLVVEMVVIVMVVLSSLVMAVTTMVVVILAKAGGCSCWWWRQRQ